MTQDKRSPANRRPFGFTNRDIVLLCALIVLLIIGFIPSRLLIQCRRGSDNFLCSPSEEPAASITEATITQETATQEPTEEPPAQPTDEPTETPTSQPTDTPTTQPPAQPTAELTTEPTVQPTDEPTTEPQLSEPAPLPPPATVIYVQSSGQTHDLGLVTSAGDLIDASLPQHAAAPAWSPDGAKIAFFGEPAINALKGFYLEGEGIWTVDARGENPNQLFKTNYVKHLAWSPDSSKLAFEFGPPDNTREIVIIDAGDGHQLSRFPGGEQPAWSPDSQRLAIKACLPDCGLWQIDLNGNDKKQLTFVSSDSYPTWSPDGQYLAFTSPDRDGDWEIYRLRLANGNLLRLTNRPGADITPVFRPDGQEIYLRTNAFGDWRITVIALDGSNERLVREDVGPSEDWGLAQPAVR